MSPPRGAPVASSPHTETTSHGTPSTNLTSFTPEGAPGTSKSAKRMPKTLLGEGNGGLNIRVVKSGTGR